MSEPLSPSQALAAVIAHINASGKSIHIGWDEVGRWQIDALALLVGVRLLSKGNDAHSLECNGCEHRCFMPVERTDDKQRAFIVCDHSEMQSHMGRIAVPLQRLKQWKTSPKHFAVAVAKLLGFEGEPQAANDGASYQLGMLKSKGGRRWVSLAVSSLEIVINQHPTPVSDLLYIDNNTLVIDRERIDSMLNSATKNDKAYTPNTNKQELRKLATQAMHQDWKDKYLYLSKKNPEKKDEWYAWEISKLPIAQEKKPETIRKNMK
jgi:hypothetical protein